MSAMTQLKLIATDQRWLTFHLQRLVKSPETRKSLAERFASWTGKMRKGEHSASSADAQAAAHELNSSGLYRLGTLLDQQQCKEVYDHLTTQKVYDSYDKKAENFLPLSDERRDGAHVAHHFPEDLLQTPHLLNVANDPKILAIAEAFLGFKPTIGFMTCWWSYPTGLSPQQAENFHRDVDDLRFLKLFLYITKVGPKNGPHKYVLGSSSKPAFLGPGRLTDEQVESEFGAEAIQTMTSGAGEAFLEDTYGIHKGQPLQEGHRLLFQVVYTLSAIPYGPRKPVASLKDHPGFDPFVNRVYFS